MRKNKQIQAGILALALAASFIFLPKVSKASDGDTWISEKAVEACIDCGQRYNICPELLMAMVEMESSGKADAQNGEFLGLMQIAERWHLERMERLGAWNLFDEADNILIGTDYLAELLEKYEDVGVALMVYHGESDAENKTELSDYAERILTRSAELERLHGK